MKHTLISIYTLWFREIIRFLRQKNRVMSAVGQPLIFWLLLGFGFKSTFQYPGVEMNYLQYFFPGIVTLVLLFTAIFSSFSLIEDRNEGFLQGVLVSPAPRLSIVLGKITGGATLALIQSVLFMLIAPLIGLSLSITSLILILLMSFLIALGMTGFGFCLAWRMDSTQGFHAIMMLILLPMWFLSGAFFPATGLPKIFSLIMHLNPLTYAVALLRHLFYWNNPSIALDLPSFSICLLVVITFAILTTLLSLHLASSKNR